MAKLTKKQSKDHNKVLDLINSDKPLSSVEKEFVLENYNEAANIDVGKIGSFHTPQGLAVDFSLDIGGGHILDMCAGTGMLSYWKYKYDFYNKSIKSITCVELTKEYFDIGKRILPEADWVCGDVLSYEFGKRFDWAYSNPPFGNIKTSTKDGKYTGSDFEYKIIEKASEVANNGSFILPQGSCNFKYSGNRYFEWVNNKKFEKFFKETGIEFHAGVGIDTSLYRDEWKNTKVICESVICYFQGEE